MKNILCGRISIIGFRRHRNGEKWREDEEAGFGEEEGDTHGAEEKYKGEEAGFREEEGDTTEQRRKTRERKTKGKNSLEIGKKRKIQIEQGGRWKTRGRRDMEGAIGRWGRGRNKRWDREERTRRRRKFECEGCEGRKWQVSRGRRDCRSDDAGGSLCKQQIRRWFGGGWKRGEDNTSRLGEAEVGGWNMIPAFKL
jgi:hypothetical protein